MLQLADPCRNTVRTGPGLAGIFMKFGGAGRRPAHFNSPGGLLHLMR